MSSNILIAAILVILLITTISFHALQGDTYASATASHSHSKILHAAIINPSPPDTKQLHAININLTKIDSEFKQVPSTLTKQQQSEFQKLLGQHISYECGNISSKLAALIDKNHGSLTDPQATAEIQGIIASANSIISKANSFQHQDPPFQNVLNGIVANTNKIIATACTLMSCVGR